MQKFILEVIPIIHLWALENKTAIDVSDQQLKKVLGKLKVEQLLLNKVEGQEVKEESNDYSNAKVFDFVTERQNREVKLGKERYKKGESKKIGRKGKKKGVKGKRRLHESRGRKSNRNI